MNDLNSIYQLGSVILYSVMIVTPIIHLALEKLNVVRA